MKTNSIDSWKEKLVKFLSNTMFLTVGFAIIGFVVMISGRVINVLLFSNTLSDKLFNATFILGLIIELFSGVFIVKRREIPRPGLPSIKGILAVIQGFLFILLCTIGIVGMVYYTYFQ